MIRQRIQLSPHTNPCRCLLILMPSILPAATKIGKFAVFVSLANSAAKFTKITKFRNSGKEMPPDGWRIFRSFSVLSFCYLHSFVVLDHPCRIFFKAKSKMADWGERQHLRIHQICENMHDNYKTCKRAQSWTYNWFNTRKKSPKFFRASHYCIVVTRKITGIAISRTWRFLFGHLNLSATYRVNMNWW